ncbi:conserved hypothetical protein [Talaromyces stipitatus ATCC 10500]|uniref:Uncharacterized protein n=1 Tax=Talaromyces stipitatus (strain ATCC 10500 / CBS 375.48 / QM 6759 / NRRL 1006) TaxID=441959 RepID=B8LXM4_TALSN|nr:uncharacterized protein TSTA_078800 [Talaromyces stipitatus ATCC 10500]EED24525.1 conserved hypothetical protein [Talaromyces stipitatus ATCC 10500]
MAAPSDITLQNLNGKYTMNKTLSSDTDAILSLQGIGWVTRRVIGLATITLHIKEYVEPNNDDPANAPATKIDIGQFLTGGIEASPEYRITDWRAREHDDRIFGKIVGQSRLIRGSKGADGKVRPDFGLETTPREDKIAKFLRGEITIDGEEDPNGFLVDDVKDKDGLVYGDGEGLWLHNWVRSLNSGWTAEQIWGFETISGQRYYTRRVVVADKNGKYLLGRLVYDYLGPLE